MSEATALLFRLKRRSGKHPLFHARRVLIPLLVSAALTVLPVAAQSTPSIVPGEQTVTLAAGAPVEFSYSATPGEVITISAAGSVDPTLEVLTAEGIRLAYNDDRVGDNVPLPRSAALIPDLLLPDGGAIRIRVAAFDGAAGAVTLLFTSDLAAPPTPIAAASGASLTAAAQASGQTIGTATGSLTGAATGSLTGSTAETDGNISSDTVFTGTVPRGGDFTSTLTAAAGDVLTVTVRALEIALDPKVEILDPSGSVIAANDDHGTSDAALDQFDSLVSNVTLTSTGDYTIRVDGYGATFGQFELTIVLVSSGTTPITTGEPVVVADGDSVTETITLPVGDLYIYELPVTAGEVYFFTVRALEEQVDPFLFVDDPRGMRVGFNDDQGGVYPDLDFLDTALGNLIMTQTGTYQLTLGEYSDAGGRVELTITRVATGAPTTTPTQEVVRGTIAPNGLFTHTVTATAGEYLSLLVNARTSALDTRVALYSADGVLLSENDDHSSELDELSFPTDSLIRNFIIPADGDYTVEVSGFADSAGEFNLLIRRPRS